MVTDNKMRNRFSSRGSECLNEILEPMLIFKTYFCEKFLRTGAPEMPKWFHSIREI